MARIKCPKCDHWFEPTQHAPDPRPSAKYRGGGGFKKLDDTSEMPFGKHKGERMQDVPPSYLHFLWTSGANEKVSEGGVAEYISRNLDALKQENPDLIWD